MEVTDNDKLTSLLRYWINHGCKKFYSARPRPKLRTLTFCKFEIYSILIYSSTLSLTREPPLNSKLHSFLVSDTLTLVYYLWLRPALKSQSVAIMLTPFLYTDVVWHKNGLAFQIGLYYPPDGVTNPKYLLLCFLTTNFFAKWTSSQSMYRETFVTQLCLQIWSGGTSVLLASLNWHHFGPAILPPGWHHVLFTFLNN